MFGVFLGGGRIGRFGGGVGWCCIGRYSWVEEEEEEEKRRDFCVEEEDGE